MEHVVSEGVEGPEEPFVVKKSLKPLSPSGDLSKRDDEPATLFFKRKIKKMGKTEHASDYLHARGYDDMQGDTSRIVVREVPKDKVC